MPNTDAARSRSRATWAGAFPSSNTRRTTPALNSSVKLLRGRGAFFSSVLRILPTSPRVSTEADRAHKSISIVKDVGKYLTSENRRKNRLGPNPEATATPPRIAEGDHSVPKRDTDGKLTGFAEYVPNPKNPSGWDEKKRVDVKGKAHTNSDGTSVPTPHVHEAGVKDVRPPTAEETPK